MPLFTHSLAFVFNHNLDQVILIKKQRPAWQKGFWNGLGGKIEPGESIDECVVREVEEESGIRIPNGHWTKVGVLTSPDWHAQIYTTQLEKTDKTLVSETGEQVAWFSVTKLPKVIDNLPWLIPLCINKLQTPELNVVTAEYYPSDRR